MADRKTEERKHLFGTTEKSDFILNMTQEQTYKLCGIYSMIAISVLLAINVMYTIAKHTFDYVEDGITHNAEDLFAAAGFFSIEKEVCGDNRHNEHDHCSDHYTAGKHHKYRYHNQHYQRYEV